MTSWCGSDVVVVDAFAGSGVEVRDVVGWPREVVDVGCSCSAVLITVVGNGVVVGNKAGGLSGTNK